MEQPLFLNATQMNSPVTGTDAVARGAKALPENPFVGLRPFESKEAVLFFGRRDQTKDLLSILHGSRFVSVVGSSGCGKSSLIRAGLIPNLQAGFVAGRVDRWNIVTMKPGDSPLQNLATTLLHSFQEKPGPAQVDALVREISLHGVGAVTAFLEAQTKGVKTNFLLLVDQFEEIFRFASYQDADEKTAADQSRINELIRETRREEAADFVSIMLDLVVQESIPVYVVMTMRSDFLGECDAFYGLPEAMNRSQYLVPRLTRQQRQASIDNPVLLYGATISERLTDRVLNDMEDERDQLPIMQHALMRTWEKWQIKKDGPLDLLHYHDAGTVAEALSRDAEDALKGLSSEELIVAERMFQALTTTDAKGRRLRRPIRFSELAAITDSGEVVLKLIDRFRSNNRSFLMLSEDRDPLVDISHESLIRQWARLRKWVDDEVESRELYLRLASDAVRQRANEAPLWSDPALQLALNWWSGRKPTEAWGRRYHQEFKLTEEFLKASEKKRDDEVLKVQRLQDEQVRREREEFERAQRQAELDKEQAEKLAAARTSTIRRTRIFAFILLVFSLLVSLTAAWAFRAQRNAKAKEKEANDARSRLEEQQKELKGKQEQLELAYTTLGGEKKKADELRKDAEDAKKEADLQAALAKSEQARTLAALKKADQTAAADDLRRQAASEQNAADTEAAEATYLKAADAYEKIQNREGVAFTYSEVGNMLTAKQENGQIVREDRRGLLQRWEQEAKANWVDHVLLRLPTPTDAAANPGNPYFGTIGLTNTQTRGLRYYAEAIRVYGQGGGVSGFNGRAAVLDTVGDLMASKYGEVQDAEVQAFAVHQRAVATRDSFCAALDNYRSAKNAKGQIAVLIKIGDNLSDFEDDAEEDKQGTDAELSPKIRSRDVGGCQHVSDDSSDYYEQAAKLYPDVLKRYPRGSSQLKKNQESFVALLLKLGTRYNEQAHAADSPDGIDHHKLKLALAKFDQAVKVYEDDKDLENTVKTLREIGNRFGEEDLRIKYYDLAVAKYHDAGRVEDEAATLGWVAGRLANRSPLDEDSGRALGNRQAIKYLERELEIYKKLGKVEEYALIYSTFGRAYQGLRQQDKALAAYQSALDNSLRTNEPRALVRDYYNLGSIQEAKGQKEEAQRSYEAALYVPDVPPIYIYRRNAENALKRLRGVQPSPTPTPPKPNEKSLPSPTP